MLLGAPGTEPVPVGAVVSLCLPGTAGGPARSPAWSTFGCGCRAVREATAGLPYVLDQAARQVLRLRRAGKPVLLHSAAGPTRASAVAAVYGHLIGGVPDGSLPVSGHPELRAAVRLLTSAPAPDAPYDAGAPATPLPAARTAAPQEDVADDDGAEEQPELDRERPRLREEALPRVRGLLLGLALGDTLGNARDALPDRGPLPAGGRHPVGLPDGRGHHPRHWWPLVGRAERRRQVGGPPGGRGPRSGRPAHPAPRTGRSARH